jgi:hypothetical protein
MKETGLAVELLETRHVSEAFKAMSVNSDRNDAQTASRSSSARAGHDREKLDRSG